MIFLKVYISNYFYLIYKWIKKFWFEYILNFCSDISCNIFMFDWVHYVRNYQLNDNYLMFGCISLGWKDGHQQISGECGELCRDSEEWEWTQDLEMYYL